MLKPLVRSTTIALPLCAAAALAFALAPADAQPPVRRAGTAILLDTSVSRTAAAIARADGSFLINDISRRVVWSLDPHTARLDALVGAGTTNAYGSGTALLLPWAADSMLLTDQRAGVIRVLDPSGRVGRLLPLPGWLNVSVQTTHRRGAGVAVLDTASLLLRPEAPFPEFPNDTATAALHRTATTVPLVRRGLRRSTLDTIAWLTSDPIRTLFTRNTNGGWTVRTVETPMPVGDDWLVQPDGSLVVIRSTPFALDVYPPSSRVPRRTLLAHVSRPLGVAERQALIDGLRAQRARQIAERGIPRRVNGAVGSAGGALGLGAVATSAEMDSVLIVAPDELPDSVPPFRVGSAIVDTRHRVWLRSWRAHPDGTLYEVVAPDRGRIAQVIIPEERRVLAVSDRWVLAIPLSTSSGRLELYRIPEL